MKQDLLYAITPADPLGHYFDVALTIRRPNPGGQRVALPAWTPGSYMIREFARHVVEISARSAGRARELLKIDKHTWEIEPCKSSLTIRYRVYAWDLSVRGAHLDATHAFFNGSSVFLRVIGQEDSACLLRLRAPTGSAYRSWRVAGSMTKVRTDARGFGQYSAADYEELIDHPFEIGEFVSTKFRVGQAQHEIVVTGRHDADLTRLAADLSRVCDTHIRMFDPRSRHAPLSRYVFLVTAIGDGYGGLEHRASTALLCSRNDLPWAGMKAISDGYRRFLGLASHEYFHTWNVKRIRPAAFARLNLDSENYTRLLWVFEGFTSYYDDLALVRCGLIDEDKYLGILAEAIGSITRNPGSGMQTLADASFDAWIKYYRQDENAPNAIVSYYVKGGLIALALDLTLRGRSHGRFSLDDVMRLMWQRYGKHFDRNRTGVAEAEMPDLIREATGLDLTRELSAWTEQTQQVDLGRALKPFGIKLEQKKPTDTVSLGMRTAQKAGDLVVVNVYNGGAAHRAGLSAGDVLAAVNGLRVDESGLAKMLARLKPNQRIKITAFRRDEMMNLVLETAEPDSPGVELKIDAAAGIRAAKLRHGWLQHP